MRIWNKGLQLLGIEPCRLCGLSN